MPSAPRMLVCALGFVLIPLLAWSQQGNGLPPRTFPDFVGTWLIDDAASTGELRMPVAHTLTITTTRESIHVIKLMRWPPLPPEREGSRRPFETEVYRFDGTETSLADGSRGTFLLVADALVLTTRRGDPARGDNIGVVTDAYSVTGDLLTLRRQISTILLPAGHIATMTGAAANVHHTYVYRRASAGSRISAAFGIGFERRVRVHAGPVWASDWVNLRLPHKMQLASLAIRVRENCIPLRRGLRRVQAHAPAAPSADTSPARHTWQGAAALAVERRAGIPTHDRFGVARIGQLHLPASFGTSPSVSMSAMRCLSSAPSDNLLLLRRRPEARGPALSIPRKTHEGSARTDEHFQTRTWSSKQGSLRPQTELGRYATCPLLPPRDENSELVRDEVANVVHDQRFHRNVHPLESQPNLFAQCVVHRGKVAGIAGANDTDGRQPIGNVDFVSPREASPINDRKSQLKLK